MDWKKDVFKKAVEKSNEIRSKHPELKVTESIQRAWRDPEIVKLKEKYEREKRKK